MHLVSAESLSPHSCSPLTKHIWILIEGLESVAHTHIVYLASSFVFEEDEGSCWAKAMASTVPSSSTKDAKPAEQ
jgi:hypothetical protein